ncbi:acyl-CoA dehydrogenase family protein [Pseudomonas sp. UL073]|uniref:Acyl-CoA dehydrogenase family protein n=1 Tax=Zestomonas insulae TaxID=2809017 RepID=A0ABS2IFJ8_9GAMM|nr:acyl-CoA dehydrogenase family protein [Pseudomonas insulae]MBM7061866.1 acyl-CoA dehydrogenase family protein [Pseudomonas insulae]
MDFTFSDEQQMLRDLLARYLDEQYGFDKRMAAVNSAEGWRPACWQAFAHELGILAAGFPEELGGLGGGSTENLIVMEAFGRALVLEPYLSTVVLGGGVLKRVGGESAAHLIAQIGAGEVRIAWAQYEAQSRYCLHDVQLSARRDGDSYVLNGNKTVVLDAPYATHLLVSVRTAGERRERNGISLLLVEQGADGLRRQDYPTVDGGRAAELFFDNVRVPASALLGAQDQGLELLEVVFDEALVALCAEGVGIMQRMLADTVAYAKERKQFGVPIGTFQALQHRMVDMYIHIEQASALTYLANLKLSESPVERARAASAAKVRVGKALKAVGQGAVQVHGGMGITEELAVGHYFKRATVIEQQFGSVDHHLRRYGELAGS